MRVWPGRPYPLGATWDGRGVNFALYSENATRVELCLFDSAEATTGIGARSTCPNRPTWSGTATCPTCGRASSTAIASTVRTSRTKGHRFNPTRCCSIRTRKRSCGTTALGRCDVRLQGRRPAGGFVVRRARQRRHGAAGGRHRSGLHLGRRSAAADAVAQDAHLRTARQGLHAAASRSARAAARHLRGARVRGGDPASPKRLGVTAVELLPVHHHRRRSASGRTRAVELLGLQHARLLRPGHAISSRATATATRCASSRRWSAICTRPASKSFSTWSTTTRPKETSWARRSRSAASTTPPTTGSRPRTPATTWTSPAAATRSTCAIRACCS